MPSKGAKFTVITKTIENHEIRFQERAGLHFYSRNMPLTISEEIEVSVFGAKRGKYSAVVRTARDVQ